MGKKEKKLKEKKKKKKGQDVYPEVVTPFAWVSPYNAVRSEIKMTTKPGRLIRVYSTASAGVTGS